MGRSPEKASLAFLRTQLRRKHQLASDQLAGLIDGRANGELVVDHESLWTSMHDLCIEDIAVNLIIEGRRPLFRQIWAGGLRLPTDAAGSRAYAAAVHAASDAVVARLVPADLDRPIDLSVVGLTPATLRWVLQTFVLRDKDISFEEAGRDRIAA